jgi:DNA-binding response OmpR family regulator
MISGAADPEEIRQLHAAGADGFLQKPFDTRELLARIEGVILGRRRSA